MGSLFFVAPSEAQLKRKLPLGLAGRRCSLCDAAPVCSSCCGLLIVRQVGCSILLCPPPSRADSQAGPGKSRDAGICSKVTNIHSRAENSSYTILCRKYFWKCRKWLTLWIIFIKTDVTCILGLFQIWSVKLGARGLNQFFSMD